MPESDKLRNRATQLFAMALKARETGFASAAELEKLGAEALALAEEMERGASAPPPPPEAPPQVAQQQQQPQPEKE